MARAVDPFPVSVKGIVVDDEGRFLLAANDRQQWELLGGRPEPGEDPREALGREIREEAGLEVTVGEQPLCSYLFDVLSSRNSWVRIVVYGCGPVSAGSSLRVSDEHLELAWFDATALAALPDLPVGYKNAVERFLDG